MQKTQLNCQNYAAYMCKQASILHSLIYPQFWLYSMVSNILITKIRAQII